MSKLDAMRAMREANYAASQARADKPAAATRPKPATAAAPKSRAATQARAGSAADPAGEELCGHRNMSGRTCTREKAHSAKSHRYS
ncbi:hypothetical protein [Marmoricola sp. RAF53]|uniref:hypothetical protein n=1 Tax=Marmoricola sp. RAF53 TaxID=3233059 RepID=UPI003F9C23BD